jgi:hypothetical protein
MSKFVVLIGVLAVAQCIFAATQVLEQVPILRQDMQNDGLGSFQYSFESGDGIKQDVTGSLKTIDVPKFDDNGRSLGTEQVTAEVQSGSFSYAQPDGTIISVKWIADESMFS